MDTAFQPEKQNRSRSLLFLFCGGLLLLAAGMLFSLKFGQAKLGWGTLLEAIAYRGHDKLHLYIQTLRLPRTVTACIVGAQLALAGLLTQLATRNPLASPHIFGINAGASMAVVLGMIGTAGLGLISSMLLAFAGAIAGAALVWLLAGGERRQQYVRLALAGITVHFLLSSLTEGAMVLKQYATEGMIFWLVGSVNRAGWHEVQALLPFFLGGLVLIAAMTPSLRLLLLDDDITVGLGQRIAVVRGIALLLVIALAGSAVAVCGPIGFVCLIVPHIARALAGPRLPALVPLTALLGAVLLVYADLLSRFVAFPFESPVGIVTAAIGAPFFIYLSRRQGGGGLR